MPGFLLTRFARAIEQQYQGGWPITYADDEQFYTTAVLLEHFSFFRSRLHRQAFASLARAMILAKEAGDGGMPMARTARAAFTKSSPVPVWLQYFEKCSSG